MKIVHIAISEKYVEGMSYQENLLSKAHIRLGNEVFVIAQQCFVNKDKEQICRSIGTYINDDGICITILPYAHKNKVLRLLCPITRGLYERLNEILPDVIFVHGVTAADNILIARYVKEHPQTKLYADNHNDYYNSPLKGIKGFFVKIAIRRNASFLLPYVQTVWGTTPWRVEYLQDQYNVPKEKTELLIMGAEEQYIQGKNIKEIRSVVRSEYNIPDDAFLVVTGGALDKRKQQKLLMEAVKDLSKQNIWLLAFGAPTKEMEPVFRSYQEVPNIVMTGWLPAVKGYDMFLASDLAFFPGTHSVLWEQAAACGVPVVVKQWRGMEHINVNGNAMLVSEVNIETIKETIVALHFTPLYDEMKEKAQKAAASFFLSKIAKNAIGER